jgi:hypothetical protein
VLARRFTNALLGWCCWASEQELTLGAVDLDSIEKKYAAVHIGKSDETA